MLVENRQSGSWRRSENTEAEEEMMGIKKTETTERLSNCYISLFSIYLFKNRQIIEPWLYSSVIFTGHTVSWWRLMHVIFQHNLFMIPPSVDKFSYWIFYFFSTTLTSMIDMISQSEYECITELLPLVQLSLHFAVQNKRDLHNVLMFSICAPGLGGACGYLVGAMDWGHSVLGRVLGSEYQVIYFFSAITWGIFLIVHLFSIPEKPLSKGPSASDASSPSALHLLGSHSNGYGSLGKEPASQVSQAPATDLRPRSLSTMSERPRSFSALGEANSVTSSAKQPNKEVRESPGSS